MIEFVWFFLLFVWIICLIKGCFHCDDVDLFASLVFFPCLLLIVGSILCEKHQLSGKEPVQIERKVNK